LEHPRMGPVATGLGEVYHYVVTAKGDDTEARTIHDWIIRPQLRTVKGVAEVNSWGGDEKQNPGLLGPSALVKYGLTFNQVADAVEANNRNVGGGNVARAEQMLLVHGIGRVANADEIEAIEVTAHDGKPVKIGNVAKVQVGHEIRRGAV